VGAAAADVLAITTELGIERFAVMGASGGGPHALACAALLPERVSAAATFASPAPFTREFDWFAGMVAPGGLRSASEGGREGRAAFAETDEFDERQFVDVDWQTLGGAWRALGQDAAAAAQASPDGLIDDDVAFVRPWGFELDRVHAPVLLVQGDADRVVPPSHARWLADHLPDAELWLRSGDGHVSVLEAVPAAMDWLIARSAPA
jgi:pimeloyl-ACP methyl ester carboxylesterase